MKKGLSFVQLLTVIWLLMWLSGCVKVIQDPEVDYMLSHLIDIHDVPPGWQHCCSRIEDVPGAKARFRGYYGPNGDEETWISVSQYLLLYPNVDTAETSFPTLLKEKFPTSAWNTPEPLQSINYEWADQAKAACMEANVNGQLLYACKAIGQYGRVVSVIYANVIPNGELTFEQFVELLEAVDSKLADASSLDPG